MVYLTRIEYFNAAHKLWNEKWPAEKNHEVFGKCSNENFHGHNYELYVTIKGEPSDDTGFIFNANDLSLIVREHISNKLDHKNLNLDVEMMKGKLTTAENLVIAIWQELESVLSGKGVQLHSLKLMETQHIYVEYFG